MDENKSSRELDDSALGGVSGGIGAHEEYLCPCSGCELDTQWRLSPDGAIVICTNCGAVKMRRWYDENKVRRK